MPRCPRDVQICTLPHLLLQHRTGPIDALSTDKSLGKSRLEIPSSTVGNKVTLQGQVLASLSSFTPAPVCLSARGIGATGQGPSNA